MSGVFGYRLNQVASDLGIDVGDMLTQRYEAPTASPEQPTEQKAEPTDDGLDTVLRPRNGSLSIIA